MKILHIIDSGGLYGAEAVLLSLVHEQIKLGINPTICSIGERGAGQKELEAEAIRRGFRVVPFRMRKGPNFPAAWELLRRAKTEKFDLLHSHGYKGNILFGFIPRKIRKIPLVCTVHGWTSCNGFSKMRIYEWLDAKSLRFSDAVVLVSKALLENSRLIGKNTKNISVVNNGIPPLEPLRHRSFSSSLNHSNCPIRAFCNARPTIGSIGRLSPEKGYRNLIEAFHLLLQKGVDAHLIIIGEGNERRQLEKVIQSKKIQHKVLLPGYKTNAKGYLRNFSIFVLPSLTEGLPITLLEAMRANIPIVATSVGGIPSVLQNGDAGILVNPGDTPSLAQALYSSLKNISLRSRITVKAEKIVNNNYSSSKMAKQYHRIYNAILNNKNREAIQC